MGHFGWHFDLAAYVFEGPPADPAEHVSAVLEREKEEVLLEHGPTHEVVQVGQRQMQRVNHYGPTGKLEYDEDEAAQSREEDKHRHAERVAAVFQQA